MPTSIWIRLFALQSLIVLILAGCGGNGATEVSSAPAQAPTVSAPAPILSGIVRSETGVGLAGVRLVVHERTTDIKIEGLSGSDGSFALSLPTGVYDLGLDRANDPQTATCYYGPLVLSSDFQRDFVLMGSAGKPVNRLFGKIQLQSGTPATGRRVRLLPVMAISEPGETLPAAVETITDAAGAFELALGSNVEVGLDVEVYEPDGSLDEHIDVAKRDKPCYVEFTTEESSVENAFRAGESDLGPLSGARVREGPAEVREFRPFTWTLLDRENLRLQNGLIEVGTEKLLREIVDPVLSDGHFIGLFVLSRPRISVARNGAHWYTFAVNIYISRYSSWDFFDETGESYRLGAGGFDGVASWFKVSYNSDRPNINTIRVHQPR